jgi:hypothetical protein
MDMISLDPTERTLQMKEQVLVRLRKEILIEILANIPVKVIISKLIIKPRLLINEGFALYCGGIVKVVLFCFSQNGFDDLLSKTLIDSTFSVLNKIMVGTRTLDTEHLICWFYRHQF